MNDTWVICPICKNKTRLKIREDTELKNRCLLVRGMPKQNEGSSITIKAAVFLFKKVKQGIELREIRSRKV